MRTRDLEGRWYDVFADWDFDDQAAALKVLEALHRQKARGKQQLAMATRGPVCEACTAATGRTVWHTIDSPEHERMAKAAE